MIKDIITYTLGFIVNRKKSFRNSRNKEKIVMSYRKKSIICFLLFSTFLMAAIIATYNINYNYLLLSLISLPFLFYGKKYRASYLKLKLVNDWESFQRVDEEQESRHKKFYENYLFHNLELLGDEELIDCHTWKDLGMENIYGMLDRNLTSLGKSLLFFRLKMPYLSKPKLLEDTEIIDEIINNRSLREELLYSLNNLGFDRYGSLENKIFDKKIGSDTKFKFIYQFLGIMGYISLLSIYFLGETSLIIIIPLFIVNLSITYILKNRYEQGIPFLIELRKMVVSSLLIGKIENPKLEIITSRLRKCNSHLKPFIMKSNRIVPKMGSILDSIYDYIKIFFLLEVRIYYSSIDFINKNINTIREIYGIVGKLDLFQSIASYKNRYKNKICTPEFLENTVEFELIDVYNPLINDPIPNNLSFNRDSKLGIVITGTNMSGKTTLLRTIGINIILAQSFNFSHSKKFRGFFLLPITSINNSDNLTKGRSFYYSEAERILSIIKKCEQNPKIVYLVMLDEILKGTNSLERFSGSYGIVQYFYNLNSINIVVTHDIDLANKLTRYDTYHFIDGVDENGLNFDYKLKQGITKESNAIKLLKFMKYPKEVIEKANENLERV